MVHPANRSEALACIPLLLKRGDEETLMPDPETRLQAGDRLLFCGERQARSLQSLGLYNFNVLSYLLSGQDVPGGKVWRWLERLAKKPGAGNPAREQA
jgi:hypothetical protein